MYDKIPVKKYVGNVNIFSLVMVNIMPKAKCNHPKERLMTDGTCECVKCGQRRQRTQEETDIHNTFKKLFKIMADPR